MDALNVVHMTKNEVGHKLRGVYHQRGVVKGGWTAANFVAPSSLVPNEKRYYVDQQPLNALIVH